MWAIVFLLSLLPVSNAVTWEDLVFFPEQLDELGENFYFSFKTALGGVHEV